MAKVFFEGIQRLDFDSSDGKHIQGYNLHIAYPDENVIGRMTSKKFLSDEAFDNLGFTVDNLASLTQSDVELETNIKGKIIGIKPIKS